ncbi:hypothetical protein JK207_00530 [Gluconobacter cerinus]|uniref:glycine-rich domain-containing protein n=1 Tax=Gluconobacter cerinus TaxID=38307 RepID=UPI001B8D937D|nr:hypothetical protein [Gluconobacter cerinus]MBS1020521.1 hypothetical protein [Gluconobacter cerinus]
MARLADFVIETSSNPGTGDFVLNGAPVGRVPFSSAFSDQETVYYFADDGTQAEWGLGTLTVGPPAILKRTRVLGNTYANSGILRLMGQVQVYNEVPARFLPLLDDQGALTLDAITALESLTVPRVTSWDGQQAVAAQDANARFIRGVPNQDKDRQIVQAAYDTEKGSPWICYLDDQGNLAFTWLQPQGDFATHTDLADQVSTVKDLVSHASVGFNSYNASTNLNVPNGYTRFEFYATGGGGGGSGCQGSNTSQSISGACGGSGATIYGVLSVKGGDLLGLTIGGGGSGGSGSGSPAQLGGDTIVALNGSYIVTAHGGDHATWYATTGSAGGSGGVCTINDASKLLNYSNFNGSDGTDGQAGSAWAPNGSGGSSYWSGAGRSGSAGGRNASGYGSGGGGAYDQAMSGTSYRGGDGGQGIVFGRFLP